MLVEHITAYRVTAVTGRFVKKILLRTNILKRDFFTLNYYKNTREDILSCKGLLHRKLSSRLIGNANIEAISGSLITFDEGEQIPQRIQVFFPRVLWCPAGIDRDTIRFQGLGWLEEWPRSHMIVFLGRQLVFILCRLVYLKAFCVYQFFLQFLPSIYFIRKTPFWRSWDISGYYVNLLTMCSVQ